LLVKTQWTCILVAVLLQAGGGPLISSEALPAAGRSAWSTVRVDGAGPQDPWVKVAGDMDVFGANWSGPLQPVELWVNPARAKAAAP
jgi:hypothetical protein